MNFIILWPKFTELKSSYSFQMYFPSWRVWFPKLFSNMQKCSLWRKTIILGAIWMNFNALLYIENDLDVLVTTQPISWPVSSYIFLPSYKEWTWWDWCCFHGYEVSTWSSSVPGNQPRRRDATNSGSQKWFQPWRQTFKEQRMLLQ